MSVKASNGAQNHKHAESMDKSPAGKKAANLSLVPCKFFKAGACSAGSSCPFSHQEPGQPKQVCPWFLQGPSACKFGAKCMLAHVLPGQPMGMDRKNKRAQQLAQREVEALNANAIADQMAASPPSQDSSFLRSIPTSPAQPLDSPSSNPLQSPQTDENKRLPKRQPSSGIARALEAASKNGSVVTGFIPSPSQPSVSGISAAPVAAAKSLSSQPNAWTSTLPPSVKGETNPVPARQLGFSTSPLAHTDAAKASPVASSSPNLVHTNNPQLQNRTMPMPPSIPYPKQELYSTSPKQNQPFDQTFARHTQHHSSMSTSPPTPALVNSNKTSASSQAFGTSPFSFPGTKSIFLTPSSVGSDGTSSIEAAFAQRSASALDHAPPYHSFSSQLQPSPELIQKAHYLNQKPEYLRLEEVGDDEDQGEDLIPSSLHDLLTDSELKRHRSRQAGETLQSQYELQSRSVPSAQASGFWADLRRDADRESRRSLWNDERSRQNTIVPNPSASRSPSQTRMWNNPFDPMPSSTFLADQSRSPTQARTLLSHSPGTSLPPGLAAGMSRLHFKQPMYTADTPPSSNASGSPVAHAFSHQQLGSPAQRSPWTKASNTDVPRSSALSRRLSSPSSGHPTPNFNNLSVGSPLSQAWHGSEDASEPSPYSPWQQHPSHTSPLQARKSALQELMHDDDESLPFHIEV